jgi:hypothetical protein
MDPVISQVDRESQPPGLKALWDDVLSCREGHFACLQRVATSGTFQSVTATDASTPGYGVTKLDRQGHILWSKGGKWGDKRHDLLKVDVDAHIFYKELRAALYGLSFVPEGEKTLLVVDNAAVAWVLRNGFSRTESANQLLDKYRHLLERIYDVCLVVSADNPADCPSRGEPMEAQRVVNLNHAIASHFAGARWASQGKRLKTGLRTDTSSHPRSTVSARTTTKRKRSSSTSRRDEPRARHNVKGQGDTRVLPDRLCPITTYWPPLATSRMGMSGVYGGVQARVKL